MKGIYLYDPKLTAKQCAMLCTILAELQAEEAEIQSRQQKDRMGLGAVLTAAEIARLGGFWPRLKSCGRSSPKVAAIAPHLGRAIACRFPQGHRCECYKLRSKKRPARGGPS